MDRDSASPTTNRQFGTQKGIIPPILLSVFGLLTALPVHGQEQIVIRGAPACETCKIRMEELVRIGSSDDPHALMRTSRLAIDSRGRIFVAPTYEVGTIAVYNSGGRYEKSFGRQGQGPGEFSSRITHILIDPDDRVHVFEGPRHTILTPGLESFESVRVLDVNPANILLRPNGSIVVQNLDLSRSSGPTVHVLGMNGETRTSMDPISPSGRPDPWDVVRILADAGSGGIWSAHVNRYELTEWTEDGQPLRTVERLAPWFESWSGYDLREPAEKAPRPRITSVLAEGPGRLWVHVRVADADWSPQTTRPAENVRRRGDDRAQFYDSLIEVIDLDRRRVLASLRIDDPIAAFVGRDNLAYGARESESGEIQLVVWQVSLVDNSNGR